MMKLAALIRFLRKQLIWLTLVFCLVFMNVATLVSNTVYDGLNRVLWGAVEMVADHIPERRPKTRAEMEAEVSRARVEADTAKADADAARSHNKKLQADLDAVNAKNKTMAMDLDIKNKRVAEMAGEADTVRRSRQHAMDTAASLRARVVNSIRRNTSTEALGAVPFIGTAVFLGSVAYEMNDACQQLKELEALDAALRGKESTPLTETICLKSYEDLVATMTGADRGYAKCVSDRIAANDLNPPSCIGYDPALPTVEHSASEIFVPAVILPVIE